jgi:outer membrane receptor protein involved in Fe transport
MKYLSRVSLRAVLATSAAASALCIGQTTNAQETPSDGEAVGDIIIVTAQKREQSVIEVPQAISVLGEDTLEKLNATSFQDYVNQIPGFSMTSNTPGVSRLMLRGVNTGGVASTVSIYVDEVPFGSSTGLANGAVLSGDFDTFDIGRIEVLRGPQGTLYGASSLGGVLKFVTNEPDTSAFEAAAEAGVEDVKGGSLGYSVKGLVNIPITDQLAIRASGFYRRDGGFVDSIGNNPLPNVVAPGTNVVAGTRVEDNIDELASYGGRISALYQPTDNFSVRLSAILQNLDAQGQQFVDADPVTLKPLYGGLVQSQYHDEYTKTKYRVYSGVVDWDLGPLSLVSATSFGTLEQDVLSDFDSTVVAGLPLASLLTAAFTGGRPVGAISIQKNYTDKFTQELRLSSPESDSIEWLVGGYYTHESSGIDPQDFFITEPGTETIITNVAAIPNGDLGQAQITSKYDEYAAFANATWHISPRFDITVGGRYAHNEQTVDLLNFGLLVGPRTEAHTTSSENVFTYSIAPRYEISDDVSVYARVASGYRPGGPNAIPVGAPAGTPTTFESDETVNYEVGLKGDFADRALSLDVAAFYVDWSNIQVVAVINNTGVNANGETAVSKGVEFSTTARPTQGLSFRLNGAYTDAKLTADTPAATGGRDGDPLPFVPKWSVNFNGDYEWTAFGNATAYVGGSVSLVGDRTTNFGTRRPVPAGSPVGTVGALIKVPSYETVDLRAGVNFDQWSIRAYVRNLFDVAGVTSVSGTGGLPNNARAIGILQPRTAGLTLGVRF